MTEEEKYNYWIELAQYDFDTATAMFSTGRWFYVVFMCQQAIEKCCKGLYTLYVDDNVPKIHNIKTIFSRFKEKIPTANKVGDINEETERFFDTLSAHYITYRYPDFNNMPGQQTGKEEAEAILAKTREVFAWLLTLKPSTG
jgi:HEPN domain-containing protein